MNLSRRRVRAIVRKELREYSRRRSIFVAVAIFPLIFLIQPAAVVFLVPAASSDQLAEAHLLLYMLAVPVLTPAVLAGYAITGERDQGSLEPVLTTPIRDDEFVLGKALAVVLPSVAVAYVVYAVFIAVVALFARSEIAGAFLRPADILVQILFTPLLAACMTWIGIGISTRSSDARVAQQLSLLAGLPFVLVTSLIGFNVIPPTVGLGLAAGVALVVADVAGWRIVVPMFDRESLISGTR